jgi:hypothetical protein
VLLRRKKARALNDRRTTQTAQSPTVYLFAGEAGPLLICPTCRARYVRPDAPLEPLHRAADAPVEAGTTCCLCRLHLSNEA